MTGTVRILAGSIAAGAIASAAVMVAGTVLGTLRVLVLAPRTGEVVATLLELPLILAAGWLACDWAARTCRIPAHRLPRLAMGASALLVLLALEAGLAMAVAGTTPAAFLARFREPAAQLGLAAQLLFAAFPLLQARLRPPPR